MEKVLERRGFTEFVPEHRQRAVGVLRGQCTLHRVEARPSRVPSETHPGPEGSEETTRREAHCQHP